ncbi:MAG: hypothetical protein ACR2NX_02275 [Chthoniobacterales bacterium]
MDVRFSRSLTTAARVGLICLLASSWSTVAARKKPPDPEPEQLPSAPPAPPNKLNVLILGDSLALCGFGKRLDERFRGDARVNATFTYMTCGTTPLSWLKQKPYTNVKTQCGYWTIESENGGAPRVVEDVYGMTEGHTPKAHLVPKLEDLIEALHPDVLVMQTGSNLFGLFPDGKTVKAAHHVSVLKKYLLPFKESAIAAPSNLRKIYWVNPPVSGRIGAAVQDFLFKEVRADLAPDALVIDSRKLVSYPYQHMEPDKEHFIGAQMDEWADKVYAIIDRDLSAQPLASLRPLREVNGGAIATAPSATPAEIAARAQPVATPMIARAEPVSARPIARALPVTEFASPTPVPAMPTPMPTFAPPAEAPRQEPLVVSARLVFKSNPMTLQELLPYRESLVAYVYDIEKVIKGHYDEKQILVMHPAHIDGKMQKLKYRIGKRYKMRLDRMEGTLWDTAKARDESGQIHLLPYMRIEDLKRHPQNQRR